MSNIGGKQKTTDVRERRGLTGRKSKLSAWVVVVQRLGLNMEGGSGGEADG